MTLLPDKPCFGLLPDDVTANFKRPSFANVLQN